MATEAELQHVIADQRAQLAALEEAGQRSAKAAGIAQAIQDSGCTLHAGSAEQLARLLSEDVTAHREADGRFIPTGPGLQPLGVFVKERLAKPEYGHFIRGGGSAPAGGANQVGAGQLPSGEPRTLSDAVMFEAARVRASAPAGPAANVNMGSAFGLKAAR